MLIDVHAHFFHAGGSRIDGAERNASRLRAGARIGITAHVASILGSWGRTSPTYFPSPADVIAGNDALLEIIREHHGLVAGYACVNPNYTVHALDEIARCAAAGFIGVKLAASRRADDALLDPVCDAAESFGFPILHHIWQHRRREWPGQEASDGAELGILAGRHPNVAFILAHIGGGGDWAHTLHAVRSIPNIYVDLSGSGVDREMLDACVRAVGSERMLWGCDITIDTGLAKLRYLEQTLPPGDAALIRASNAVRIFPPGAFGQSR